MVVSGGVKNALRDAASRRYAGRSLRLPLYPPPLPRIQRAKTFVPVPDSPYNVARKRGELKYLLATESQVRWRYDATLRVAFRGKLTQLRAALPWLRVPNCHSSR